MWISLFEPERRNPTYCWEAVHFDDDGGEYKEAMNHSGVAEFSQYVGHRLVERDSCLKTDERNAPRIVMDSYCRNKFFEPMEHHNLRLKDCQGDECTMQSDKYADT